MIMNIVWLTVVFDSRNGFGAEKRISRDIEAEMGLHGTTQAVAELVLIARGVEMQSTKERQYYREIGNTRRMATGQLIQDGFMPVGYVDNNPWVKHDGRQWQNNSVEPVQLLDLRVFTFTLWRMVEPWFCNY
jgi:hypothetical protein